MARSCCRHGSSANAPPPPGIFREPALAAGTRALRSQEGPEGQRLRLVPQTRRKRAAVPSSGSQNQAVSWGVDEDEVPSPLLAQPPRVQAALWPRRMCCGHPRRGQRGLGLGTYVSDAHTGGTASVGTHLPPLSSSVSRQVGLGEIDGTRVRNIGGSAQRGQGASWREVRLGLRVGFGAQAWVCGHRVWSGTWGEMRARVGWVRHEGGELRSGTQDHIKDTMSATRQNRTRCPRTAFLDHASVPHAEGHWPHLAHHSLQ